MLLPLESATLHKKEHLTSLGPKSEMFSIRGEAKDYKKAMDCLLEHLELKKNAPMARQTFLAATERSCHFFPEGQKSQVKIVP